MKVGVEVLVNATKHGMRVDRGTLRLNAKSNEDPKDDEKKPKETESQDTKVESKATKVEANDTKVESNEVEKSEPQKEWKINDFCRAKYIEDDQVYEAQIIAFEESAGHPYAVIKFLGYGNDDNIWIENLMESLGEEIRNEQIQ